MLPLVSLVHLVLLAYLVLIVFLPPLLLLLLLLHLLLLLLPSRETRRMTVSPSATKIHHAALSLVGFRRCGTQGQPRDSRCKRCA